MLNDELKNHELFLKIDSFESEIEREVRITDWEKIELGIGEVEFIAPLDVYFKLMKSRNQVFVKGKVKTKLNLFCSRCLKNFEYDIDADFESVYVNEVFQSHSSKNEHLESLENIVYYDGVNLDLADRVVECIVLTVPPNPMCDENCRGLCTICGADMNEEPDHKCANDDIDPRFSALKDLLN